jgi:hypothetical protein
VSALCKGYLAGYLFKQAEDEPVDYHPAVMRQRFGLQTPIARQQHRSRLASHDRERQRYQERFDQAPTTTEEEKDLPLWRREKDWVAQLLDIHDRQREDLEGELKPVAKEYTDDYASSDWPEDTGRYQLAGARQAAAQARAGAVNIPPIMDTVGKIPTWGGEFRTNEGHGLSIPLPGGELGKRVLDTAKTTLPPPSTEEWARYKQEVAQRRAGPVGIPSTTKTVGKIPTGDELGKRILDTAKTDHPESPLFRMRRKSRENK